MCIGGGEVSRCSASESKGACWIHAGPGSAATSAIAGACGTCNTQEQGAAEGCGWECSGWATRRRRCMPLLDKAGQGRRGRTCTLEATVQWMTARTFGLSMPMPKAIVATTTWHSPARTHPSTHAGGPLKRLRSRSAAAAGGRSLRQAPRTQQIRAIGNSHQGQTPQVAVTLRGGERQQQQAPVPGTGYNGDGGVRGRGAGAWAHRFARRPGRCAASSRQGPRGTRRQ